MLVSYKEVLLHATFMLDVLARTPQPEEILTHGYEAEVSWKIKLVNFDGLLITQWYQLFKIYFTCSTWCGFCCRIF